MASRGSDDRDKQAGAKRDRRDDAPATDAPEEPTAAEEVGEIADPDAEPPVHPDEPTPSIPPTAMGMNRPDERPPISASNAWDRPAAPWSPNDYPPGYGRPAPDDRPSPPGQRQDVQPSAPRDEASSPPQPYNPYDTSAWRVPSTPENPPRGPYSGPMPVQQPGPDAPPRVGYSGPLPAQQPAPGQAPRGPYSGQFPAAQPPSRQSGPFPTAPSDDVRRSGTFPMPPDPTRSGAFAPIERSPDDRRSGTIPTVPEAAYQSGTYAAPPDPNAYDPARSGPMPQSPYISGAMPQVQRSGPIAYPTDVTSTGSRRVIVAPDAGFGSLLSDRPALAFLLAAVSLAGAMIVYIALRYSHFPDQIALHFGPAGASEPTRIGEKRELWTIPFIVGIVLAADTALAWAVYRFDRFAARLLTLGSGLVAAIAWVVLLTVLHR